MISNELLKGNLQTIVLQMLEANGKMYGYEITQRVKLRTEGQILITEGALYPTLHKLESQGLLKIEKVMIGKRVRKYYSLTRAGHKALSSKTNEFNAFVAAMNLILGKKTTKMT